LNPYAAAPTLSDIVTGWRFVAAYAGIFIAVVIIVRAAATLVDRRSLKSTRKRTRDKDASDQA